MSTSDDLRQQSEETFRDLRIQDTLNEKKKDGVDYANIINETTGKKPTELQLQAADYWADQCVIARRAVKKMSKEEEAQMKNNVMKDLVESGNLPELASSMVQELKNPDKIPERQAQDVRRELKIREITQIFMQKEM